VAPRIYTVWPTVSQALFGDGARVELPFVRDAMRLWSEFYRTETIKQYNSGGRRTRQMVAMAAREQGLTPTNEGNWNTVTDLSMVLDGYSGFEHALPASPQFKDVVELLARSGTIMVPTLSLDKGFKLFYRQFDPLADPRMQRFLPPDARAGYNERLVNLRTTIEIPLNVYIEYANNFAKVLAAGGCVGLGSHGNSFGFGAHWELWTYAMGGAPNHDVLRAGTMCSAEQIGHAHDLGSIEPGKIADLVVLDRNPLEDIHATAAARYVMKSGRLYESATLDEIWPRQRKLPAFWWR
jgi:hypothetical protein